MKPRNSSKKPEWESRGVGFLEILKAVTVSHVLMAFRVASVARLLALDSDFRAPDLCVDEIDFHVQPSAKPIYVANIGR